MEINELRVDLNSFNLTNSEIEQLRDHLAQQLVQFLVIKSKLPENVQIASIPGWIGMES